MERNFVDFMGFAALVCCGMKSRHVIAVFREDCLRHGHQEALQRLQRKLPFCSDLELLSRELATSALEVRRMRKVWRLLLSVAVLGIAVSLAVITQNSIPPSLRLLYCLVPSTAAIMIAGYRRNRPRLCDEPLLSAVETIRRYHEDRHPRSGC